MSTQCGGIKVDGVTLKTIEGVICEANTLIIDPTKLVSACGGQQWDGDSFKVVNIDTSHYITYCPSSESVIGDLIKHQANCCLGVDKRFFFKNENDELCLVSGYLLKLDVTPEDAIVTVLDEESEEIQPITGTVNQYIASGDISVTVQKTGYQGKSQTVTMDENKEVVIVLEQA